MTYGFGAKRGRGFSSQSLEAEELALGNTYFERFDRNLRDHLRGRGFALDEVTHIKAFKYHLISISHQAMAD